MTELTRPIRTDSSGLRALTAVSKTQVKRLQPPPSVSVFPEQCVRNSKDAESGGRVASQGYNS